MDQILAVVDVEVDGDEVDKACTVTGRGLKHTKALLPGRAGLG